jgi:hypothetical protein
VNSSRVSDREASGTAKIAPFQFGLFPPDIALQPTTTRINGWSTGLWADNEQSALSTCWINGSSGNSKGLQIGFINYGDNYSGAQFALINSCLGDFSGWQDGWINYVGGTCKGFQSGIYNFSKEMRGFQLGWINVCSRMYGLQIGVLNLNISNKFFTDLPSELAPGMVIVNWKF